MISATRKALNIIVFLILAGACEATQAQTYCKDIKKFQTQYNIFLTMPAPDFNFSKKIRQLTETSHDQLVNEWATTPERKAWIEKGFTAGLARGGQAYNSSTAFYGQSYGGYGDYCAFFKTINIEVFYNTLIYVVKDFPQNSCEFKSTMEHEFRHHRTNQRIVQKYVAALKNDLPKMVAEMEMAAGYARYDKIDASFSTMQRGLMDAIQVYNDVMYEEIKGDNALIDTLEDYKKESGRCIDDVDTYAGKQPYPLSPLEFTMIPGGFGGNPGPSALATPEQQQAVVLDPGAAPVLKRPDLVPTMPVIVPSRRGR